MLILKADARNVVSGGVNEKLVKNEDKYVYTHPTPAWLRENTCMPQPKPKGTELFNRIIASPFSVKRNEIAFKKFEHEAKSILPTDAYSYYTVLGILSCVRGDVDFMIDNHERAVAICPSERDAYNNYSRSLVSHGRFK
jgi:hypothetical protein